MTPEERRRARLQRALSEAERKLQGTRREDYEREINCRRVLTARKHKVAGLKKIMKGEG